MRLKLAFPFAVGAALALSLSACGGAASADDFLGIWGTPDTAGEPSIGFEADGAYSGNDGCNVIGGEYTLEDDGTIDLGAMHMTMMYCEGVDDWLSSSTTAKLDGSDTLVFFDEGGAEIGKLSR